jgi:hypothetical protein
LWVVGDGGLGLLIWRAAGAVGGHFVWCHMLIFRRTEPISCLVSGACRNGRSQFRSLIRRGCGADVSLHGKWENEAGAPCDARLKCCFAYHFVAFCKCERDLASSCAFIEKKGPNWLRLVILVGVRGGWTVSTRRGIARAPQATLTRCCVVRFSCSHFVPDWGSQRRAIPLL